MRKTISPGDFSGTSRNRSKSSSRKLPRIVGVDDGAVTTGREGRTVLVLVLFQGPRVLDLRLDEIEVDGMDAQRTLISMLRTLSYDVVMLSGISFAGFNLVDLRLIAKRIGKPVIAVIRERPNNKAVLAALKKHFADWRMRWRAVKNAGRLYSCKPLADEPKLYFEVKGCSPASARRIISSASSVSRLPEPVRVAGLLAKGLHGCSLKIL